MDVGFSADEHMLGVERVMGRSCLLIELSYGLCRMKMSGGPTTVS